VLVWRHSEAGVVYRILDPAECLAVSEAVAGKSFGDICALLQFRNMSDADSVAAGAANYLTQWFADGLIISVCHD
jgi:hypothetical protein